MKVITDNRPSVSVIVPVFDMEDHLDNCVRSILEQTFSSFQIIFINDGSRDDSERVIDKYVEKYPDKCMKVNKQNGGLASALNKGLEYVTGKYLTFIDADDYIDRHYLKKLFEKAESKNYQVVISGQHKITSTR